MTSTVSPQNSISWLLVARKARRLTQRELAELSGLTRVAIARIENGRSQPHRASKRALAESLGYSVEELWPAPGKLSPSNELRDWARALHGKAAHR